MAAVPVYAGIAGVVDDPGTHPRCLSAPERGSFGVSARRGAGGGASPAGRSEASTGGAGGPRRGAPKARPWYYANNSSTPAHGALVGWAR